MNGRQDNEIPTEIEASLLIAGPQPDELVRELSQLERLESFALHPRPDVHIHDRYLDTPDGALLRRLFSLRLREVNGKPRITLKGDTNQSSDALKVRSELEVDWSEMGLRAILGELAGHGVDLGPWAMELEEPLQILLSYGLQVIQERETRRVIRKVSRSGQEANSIAEMSLDAVDFYLGARTVHHLEIEVELEEGGQPEDIHAFLEALRRRYPGRLELWSISKLTLGLLLERLSDQGRLAELVAEDGRLTRQAYQAIQAVAKGAALP